MKFLLNLNYDGKIVHEIGSSIQAYDQHKTEFSSRVSAQSASGSWVYQSYWRLRDGFPNSGQTPVAMAAVDIPATEGFFSQLEFIDGRIEC